MRYGLRDIPTLLVSPPGRGHLRRAVSTRFTPMLQRPAALYRRTLLRRVQVVAVVGSLGKSTTVRAIRIALGQAGEVGNANRIRSANRLVLRTSPLAKHLVVEAGIEKMGTMKRFASAFQPDVVVATTIASEHNRSLGDLESTRREKGKMVSALRPGGTAILNADDPNVLWMQELTDRKVVTYGFAEDAEVRGLDLTLDWPRGQRLRLTVDGEEHVVTLRLVGSKMAHAALAAVAVARTQGVGVDQAISRLEQLEPMHMRLQPVQLPSGAWVIRDEFKAPFETIHAALDLLAEIPAERRIVFLGDVTDPPGSSGPIYREIGARIARTCSQAYLVSHLSRRYIVGATQAGMPREALLDVSDDPFSAAEELRETLGPGDVVLVKGRNWQRMERLSLLLAGHDVRCRLLTCRARTQCELCPMLERGWEGVRAWREVSI